MINKAHLWQTTLFVFLFAGIVTSVFGQISDTKADHSSDLIPVSIPNEPITIDVSQLPEMAAIKNESAYPNLDQRLVSLIRSQDSESDQTKPPDDSGLVLDGTKVLVEIRANPKTFELTQHRLIVEGAIPRHHNAPGLYEAWLEISDLENIAQQKDIYFIQPVRLVKTMAGTSLSQGVARSFADVWHTDGITGTGVTIAIIDSFDNNNGEVAALQTSGDWPPNAQLTIVKVGSGTFGDNDVPHGNAVLEIAYDMAPGATFIAYDTLTVGDWYTAIGLADAAGADIVSSSLGAPLDGIGDGSALPGSIAEAAANARSNGVLYVNATGNAREEHWGGLYNNHPTFDNTHNWGTGGNLNLGTYCLPNGYPIQIELFWNDWTTVNHDYDLRLYRYQNTGWVSAASSVRWQNGGAGQTPQEWINYTLPTGTRTNPYGCGTNTHVVAIMISRYSASTNRNLQLFTNLGGLAIPVNARSLGFPADSPDVMAVAAVDYNTLAQESYSSEGPILAAGGGLPTGSENPKPDITSYAGGIDTQSYGTGVFSGTSASTPHVAGWAALILANNSGFDVDDLEIEIQSIAGSSQGPYNNDLGTVGHDFQYGHGLSRFLYSPTAVSLQSFTANNSTTPFLLTITLLLMLLGCTAIIWQRKRQ